MRPEIVSGTRELVLSVEEQSLQLVINGIQSMFSFQSPDYNEIVPSNVYNL